MRSEHRKREEAAERRQQAATLTQVDWWVRQRDGASKSSSNTSERTNSNTSERRGIAAAADGGGRMEGSEREKQGDRRQWTEDRERGGQGGVSEVHDPKRRDTAAANLHNNQPRAGSNFGGAGKRMRLNWKRSDGISVDGGVWFGFMGGRRTDGGLSRAFSVAMQADTSLTP